MAGAMLLAGLIAFWAIPSWVRWNNQLQDDAGIVLHEARVAEELLLHLPALRDTLAARTDRVVALAPWTIAGETPDAAAAMLGQMLSALCGAAGLQVESLHVASDTLVWNDFAEITARLRLMGTYPSLLAGLARIETGPPMLSVTALAVWSAGDAAHGDTRNLQIDLTVTGITFNVEPEHER